MKRRSFLKTSGLVTGSLWVPQFLFGANSGVPDRAFNGKRLIVIQLSGGCDGLSAAVPYGNDLYYSNRKRTAIPESSVLRMDEIMGWNPAMEGMHRLYQEGLVTLVNNVGYPNANRSHFRSMDIWQSGSDEGEYWESGWLGRYLDHTCAGRCPAHRALEIDDSLSLAMKGEAVTGMAARDFRMLQRSIESGRIRELAATTPQADGNSPIDFLYKTLASTTSSIDYLQEHVSMYQAQSGFPDTAFGNQLKTIARLIGSGVDSTVYYASLSGFDTHAAQKEPLDRLLGQYSEGVHALVEELRQNGQLKNSLIMVFSEFGRRVEENASGGTDHGAANNVYLIGGSLKQPGILNGATDLSELDDGDLRYKMDFRSLYAGILDDWLESDHTKVLKRAYKKAAII